MSNYTKRNLIVGLAGLVAVAFAPQVVLAQAAGGNNGPSNGGPSGPGPSAGSGGGHFTSIRGYKPPRKVRRLLSEGCQCRTVSGKETCKRWTEQDGTLVSRVCTPDS